MVLYIIGLGLGDENDVTVKGRSLIQTCDLVFLEAYTSILGVDKDHLEKTYGCSIQVADRELVEQQADDLIVAPAKDKNVAFLVVGDPVSATTHTDLMLRAQQCSIKVELIHNASIMTAAGACGLQLYNFGRTVSLPFWDDNWRPMSWYDKIMYNRRGGMHTLCLLDIKVKEPDYASIMQSPRQQPKYLPPRFMTIATAAEQLIEAEATLQKQCYSVEKTLCVGLARMGQETQCIIAGTLEELRLQDFGGPLHSLVICGELHDLELEVLKQYLVLQSTYQLEELATTSPPFPET
jgi:diphthine synthase